MGNINGNKYALTALFPIKPGEHYARLSHYLRDLDKHPCGSPLAGVGCIHMARFFILQDFFYQGLPAKRDHLQTRYLVFMCDFDGPTLGVLVGAMFNAIASVVDDIWQHCWGYPGRQSRDALIAYFEKCQVDTTLFFADRPEDELTKVLQALLIKRQFVQFIDRTQGQVGATLKHQFYAMWATLQGQQPPPGSM